jgi:hypothetical protein
MVGPGVAVLISNCIYLGAAILGGLAGFTVGLPLRRRIIARWEKP